MFITHAINHVISNKRIMIINVFYGNGWVPVFVLSPRMTLLLAAAQKHIIASFTVSKSKGILNIDCN